MSSSSDDEILNYFNELLGQAGSPESSDESREQNVKQKKSDLEKPRDEVVEVEEKVVLSQKSNHDVASTISSELVEQKQQSAQPSNTASKLKDKRDDSPSFIERSEKFAPAPLVSEQNSATEHTKNATVDFEALDALQREKKMQLQALLDKGFESKTLNTQAQPSPLAEEIKEPTAKILHKAEELEVAPSESSEAELAVETSTAMPEQEVKPIGLDYLDWGDNGRPQWAQSEFDALLFKVAGLKLAVPLVCLGQIYPIEEELPQIFGQAEWFMGVQATPIGKLRIVNTALFVMPEKYNPEFLKTARYVVSIDGIHWALAVDTVEQPIKLQPHDVTWRSQRGKRPWLAGTVKSAMCALIDIPNMGEMLERSDKNRM